MANVIIKKSITQMYKMHKIYTYTAASEKKVYCDISRFWAWRNFFYPAFIFDFLLVGYTILVIYLSIYQNICPRNQLHNLLKSGWCERVCV